MSFRIALSGLAASQATLDVTANNIANANTVGFKQSRAEFTDVYATAFGSIGSLDTGAGVRLAAVTSLFTQGNIDFTGNALDLAVNGEGFFTLSDQGSNVYSRNGAFSVDRDGYVVNVTGQRLQAYPALDPQGTNFSTASLGDLQLVASDAAPRPSSTADISLNLQADSTLLGPGAIDPADASSYNYSTSLSTYDSLGQSHTSALYFRKTDTATRTWDVRMVTDGDDLQTTAVQTLTFDQLGQLTAPQPVNFGAYDPGNGAAQMDVDYDFTGTSQYGSSFAVNSLFQDGFSTGRLSGLDISDTGVVQARFSNGQTTAMGKVALANFANPQGLTPLGDSTWGDSFKAGDRRLGEPGAGNFGFLQSGALESSNVEITEELVNLITAQRSFQSNAQVISAADTITQTIMNIGR
ncbi:MAG: flagellar hook protein FlgE [Gammaproteobacteria bacterium]|nr:flagellar hook protein FlgE [Gammaproteobacteria bacterium]